MSEHINYEAAYHDLSLILGGILKKLGTIELTKEELIHADGFVEISVNDDGVVISLGEYENDELG